MIAHKLASFDLSLPYNSACFTFAHARGKRVPKKFSHTMEVVYVSFE